MQAYKRDLIELMVRADILSFGDFTTKSGRKTPYFVNTGRYRTGSQMRELSRLYAQALMAELSGELDVLFGPAYKGIPLAVATAMALYTDHGRDVAYCFDRKEAKNHGEGGTLVGHAPRDGDRVVIIEDVTTAGTSVRQSVPMLKAAADIRLSGLVVSVDRMERGTGERSALAELAQTFDMKCFAIVTIEEVMEYLVGREVDGRVVLDADTHARMRDYLAEYGGT